MLVFITDIHSLGLPAAQGLRFVTGFYWDRDDESRAWSKRFSTGISASPTAAQAAVYSAIRHDLRAIEAAGTDEAKSVMAKMREIPVDDFYVKGGSSGRTGALARHVLRAGEDAGRSALWDYYKIIATIPGDQAFRPAGEDGCPLIKR